jgi:hypothetical protein
MYWSLIKSSGDISPISQLKKENNDLISDDYEKACLLNNYFCSISTLNDCNTSTLPTTDSNDIGL